MFLAKKPKKLSKTSERSGVTTHQHRKMGAQKEDKKPKQYKSKEDRVAEYEELPIIVSFEI